MPTTKRPEDAKLTGVPATVASSPPGVRTVPAIDTADGSEIVNTWPATVTVGREATGSATEISGSDAPSDLAIGSAFRKASNISAPIPGGGCPFQLRDSLEILWLAFHLIVAADELWPVVKLCLEVQDRDVLRDGDLHYWAGFGEDQLSFQVVVRLDLI